jgi:hypothetical protein
VKGFSLDALRQVDARQLDWFFDRLIKQKQDEEEENLKQSEASNSKFPLFTKRFDA